MVSSVRTAQRDGCEAIALQRRFVCCVCAPSKDSKNSVKHIAGDNLLREREFILMTNLLAETEAQRFKFEKNKFENNLICDLQGKEALRKFSKSLRSMATPVLFCSYFG